MRKRVHVLAVGGTILSKSRDSSLGAEILGYDEVGLDIEVPGVECEIKRVMVKASFDLYPSDWITIAEAAYRSAKEGVDGIVILHGTDTMQYSASALSFMLQNPGIPIVFTGSMIPGGNPGSDAVSNARAAVRFAAYGDLGEVCVIFSEDEKAERKIVIRGTRAKKIHSYAVNAFASINSEPIGRVVGEHIELNPFRVRRGDTEIKLKKEINPNAFLLKFTPAVTPEHLRRFLTMFDGLVIEGTGLGHVRTDETLSVIGEGHKPVVLSTQCLYGGERLGIYALDKKILSTDNIIPARDMLPETALVKLMWALGQGGDVREIMLTNIAGEISSDSNR